MTGNFILLIIRGGDRKKMRKKKIASLLAEDTFINIPLSKRWTPSTKQTDWQPTTPSISGRASLVLPRVGVALSGTPSREERATNRKKTHGVFVLVSGVRGGR